MVSRELMFRLAGNTAICLAALVAPMSGTERVGALAAFSLGVGLAAVLPGYEREAARIVGPAVLLLAVGPATELWIVVNLLALMVVGFACFDHGGLSRTVPALGLPVITLVFRTGQPASGPLLGAWLALVVATLVSGTRLSSTPVEAPHPAGGTVRPAEPGRRPGPGSPVITTGGPGHPTVAGAESFRWRRMALTLGAVCLVTPLSLGLATLAAPHLPDLAPTRPAAGSEGGAALDAHPGLSGGLDTGLPVELGDEEVLRVRSDQPLFWRAVAYDQWDGRRWSRTMDERWVEWTETGAEIPPVDGHGGGADADPGDGIELPDGLDLPEPKVVRQEYEVMQAGLDTVVGAWQPTRLWAPDGSGFLGEDGSIRLDRPLEAGARWTVESTVVPAEPVHLRAADPLTVAPDSPIVARYGTEDQVPVEVARLAREITEPYDTTYDRIEALEAWIAEEITYTRDIEPLPPGSDAVQQLLFVTKQGFCEQIGSALVVMLRSLGVPARLVVGYVPPEEIDGLSGQWVSRADDAHAWAEVWFPGIGWQSFDPTAQVPLASEPVPSGLPVLAMTAPAVAGAAVLAAGWWFRRRRNRSADGGDPSSRRLTIGPLMTAYDRCGRRLGLEWSAAQTVRERGEELVAAGIDPAVVSGVVETLERLWYAVPGSDQGLDPDLVDDARDRIDELTRVAGELADGLSPVPADRDGSG